MRMHKIDFMNLLLRDILLRKEGYVSQGLTGQIFKIILLQDIGMTFVHNLRLS